MIFKGGDNLSPPFSMKITFSDHARYQIRVRELTAKQVRLVVTKPDSFRAQSDGRIQAAKKEIYAGKTYLLVVIYEQDKQRVEVITVFRTSKIKKYL